MVGAARPRSNCMIGIDWGILNVIERGRLTILTDNIDMAVVDDGIQAGTPARKWRRFLFHPPTEMVCHQNLVVPLEHCCRR